MQGESKKSALVQKQKLLYTTCVRGGPQLSSFSLMIITIVRGGRGFKNDDKYHNFEIFRKIL